MVVANCRRTLIVVLKGGSLLVPLVLLLLIIVAAIVLILMLAKQQPERKHSQPSQHAAEAGGQAPYTLPDPSGNLLTASEHPLSGRAQQALETAGQQLARLRIIAVRLADREVAAKVHALCTTSESIGTKIR